MEQPGANPDKFHLEYQGQTLDETKKIEDYIDDENAMKQALQEHADEITPELTQVLTSLIAQGQSVVDETQGQQQREKVKIYLRQILYR